MNIFMTGATGYIGGTIARRLLDDGHRLRGLVRDAEKGKKLAAFGVEPVIGDAGRCCAPHRGGAGAPMR